MHFPRSPFCIHVFYPWGRRCGQKKTSSLAQKGRRKNSGKVFKDLQKEKEQWGKFLKTCRKRKNSGKFFKDLQKEKEQWESL